MPAKWLAELRRDEKRDWLVRQIDECDTCNEERRRRCRVWYAAAANSANALNHEDDKFADAPLINPFNAPKYYASLVRAEQYAIRMKRVLLWVVAEDRPLHPDHTTLPIEELNSKREEWLTYHDQKTNGIMGMLPLVKGMPLRITVTDHRDKEKRLFKNRRCTLFGWKLHPEDHSRLASCSEPIMKLAHLPEMLFLKIPNASWTWSPDLGPGIIGISPQVISWHLDRQYEVGVERRGFTVASDFSGTAHSFAGDTLNAALIVCLAWGAKPDKPAQLSGYMCVSRVKSIDDIIIVQPYSPTLFAQGDLPGPELLLEYQRGKVDDVEEAWREKRPRKNTKAVH